MREGGGHETLVSFMHLEFVLAVKMSFFFSNVNVKESVRPSASSLYCATLNTVLQIIQIPLPESRGHADLIYTVQFSLWRPSFPQSLPLESKYYSLWFISLLHSSLQQEALWIMF